MQKFSNTSYMIYERSVMLSWIFNCGVGGGGWLLRLPRYQDQRTFIIDDYLPGLTQTCVLPGYCGMQKFFQSLLSYVRGLCFPFRDFYIF